ncbi:MAG: SPOR domain-containing protein [Aureispira sp.]|nr:SPOR domain-containing protein [Aureispira sp.]
MNLAKHIEDLLYINDCVIVPKIGGFITQYQSSSIDFIENQIHPPQKSVTFNPKLINNDGLLVNYIAQKEHISYPIAAKKVEAFADHLENTLLQKSFIYLENVGKLFFNEDAKIEFIPDPTNFFRDSYALTVVDCYPILRSKEYLKKQAAATALVSRSRGSLVATLVNNKTRVAAASVALLVVMTLPFLFGHLWQNNGTSSNNVQNASVLPSLSSQTPADDVSDKEDRTPLPNIAELNATTIDDSESKEDEPVVEEKKEETPVEVAEEVKTEEAKAITDKNDPLVSNDDYKDTKTYIIIVGAFSNKGYANRMITRLEKAGYFPDHTMTPSGMHRIGVQITCANNELSDQLGDIRSEFNKKAWVLTN